MKRIKHRKGKPYGREERYGTGRGKTVVPLELVELEDSSYHLIVRVDLDGVEGDMIIDTGASVTVVDGKLFPGKEALDEEVRMQSGSVTGEIGEVRLIRVERFGIGGCKLRRMRLAGIDMDYVNGMYDKYLKRRVVGLLGSDFCVKYGVNIDYRNREMTLYAVGQNH